MTRDQRNHAAKQPRAADAADAEAAQVAGGGELRVVRRRRRPPRRTATTEPGTGCSRWSGAISRRWSAARRGSARRRWAWRRTRPAARGGGRHQNQAGPKPGYWKRANRRALDGPKPPGHHPLRQKAVGPTVGGPEHVRTARCIWRAQHSQRVHFIKETKSECSLRSCSGSLTRKQPLPASCQHSWLSFAHAGGLNFKLNM